MRFTTPVTLLPPSSPLALTTSFVALGSCFADRMGARLSESYLRVTTNPVGIHYNPVSLARSLVSHPDPELFAHHGLWRSLDHHGHLSGRTPQECGRVLGRAEQELDEALQGAQVLLLTLGTAQVFETVVSGRIVANCHRLPQDLFRRRRLTVQESLEALGPPLEKWLRSDERRRVILTVSPVRYLRDGLVDNNRGKAILLLTCEELVSLHPRIEYFPAYEILTDELRDYRFYADDMVQPSAVAVDYIWQKFSRHYFPASIEELTRLAQKVRGLEQHRPSRLTDVEHLGEKREALLRQIRKLIPVRE